jgi:hypothetical protein
MLSERRTVRKASSSSSSDAAVTLVDGLKGKVTKGQRQSLRPTLAARHAYSSRF